MINCVGCARTNCLRFAYTEATPLLQPRALSFRRRQRFATSCSDSMAGVKALHGKEKVIVISGPTGAGKSRLALELAKQLNGEIISADSIQVYRGLDIGSAKPSLSERQEVPHHLIDILHPSEEYSAGQFFEDARQATRDVLNRGRVPIVTGGTGLYLRWFIYGKPDVPKASHEVTSEAYSELARLQRLDNWDEAVKLVVEAGDPRAQTIPANNWYRLRRSLEIIKSSGQPPSAFRVPYHSFSGQIASQLVDHSIDTKSCEAELEEGKPIELDYNFNCFFLSTRRMDLYKSIDFRCEDMLSGPDGIMSEARWLLDIGLLPNSNSATRAIGYRQAMEFILRCKEQGGGSSAKDVFYFLSEFQKASRNFAKRQLTWFRNEHIYQWIDASRPLEQVLKFMIEAYHDQSGSPPVVPDSLSMKRVSDDREAGQLKTYRTQNRVFIGRDDCSGILDWVSRTQGQTIQSMS